MLKRTLMLFKPTAPPDGQEEWGEVRAECERWSVGDREARVAWWQGIHAINRSQEKNKGPLILEAKEELVNRAVEVGRDGRMSLVKIEEQYSKGEQPKSHIHVDDAVMEQLDRIYLNHYSLDGVQALSHCFNMTSQTDYSKAVRQRYEEYLSEVQEKLESLSSSAENSVRIKGGDLQALGLKYASKKLEALFGVAHGRVCLPIPTRSMLNDLRVCLEVDKSIVAEVCDFCI